MSEPAPLFPPLKPAQAMPRLWQAGQFIADRWRVLADDEALPSEGFVILPLKRWHAEKANIVAHKAPLGVETRSDETLDVSSADVLRLELIALQFPKFSDGRAYSTARRLREAGYTGEIRAVGDVLLDQLPLMMRTGFSAFLISDAATQRALQNAPVPAVSRVYQATTALHAAERRWPNQRRG